MFPKIKLISSSYTAPFGYANNEGSPAYTRITSTIALINGFCLWRRIWLEIMYRCSLLLSLLRRHLLDQLVQHPVPLANHAQ